MQMICLWKIPFATQSSTGVCSPEDEFFVTPAGKLLAKHSAFLWTMINQGNYPPRAPPSRACLGAGR